MRNSQPNVIGVDLSVAARVAQLQAQRALVGRYWHDAMVH